MVEIIDMDFSAVDTSLGLLFDGQIRVEIVPKFIEKGRAYGNWTNFQFFALQALADVFKNGGNDGVIHRAPRDVHTGWNDGQHGHECAGNDRHGENDFGESETVGRVKPGIGRAMVVMVNR